MSFNNCGVETNHFSVASQCHMVFFQNIIFVRLRSLKWSFLRRLVRQDGLKSELFGNASQVSVKGKSAFKEQTFFKLYWKKRLKEEKVLVSCSNKCEEVFEGLAYECKPSISNWSAKRSFQDWLNAGYVRLLCSSPTKTCARWWVCEADVSIYTVSSEQGVLFARDAAGEEKSNLNEFAFTNSTCLQKSTIKYILLSKEFRLPP